ncbi:MAG: hypothetical protein KAX44_06355 [Candidatus Brocadiae bacterium]|nr:hypothetical protein [Candidatus Brocadiia bacterium]
MNPKPQSLPWKLLFCLCVPAALALGIFAGYTLRPLSLNPAMQYNSWSLGEAQMAEAQISAALPTAVWIGYTSPPPSLSLALRYGHPSVAEAETLISTFKQETEAWLSDLEREANAHYHAVIQRTEAKMAAYKQEMEARARGDEAALEAAEARMRELLAE